MKMCPFSHPKEQKPIFDLILIFVGVILLLEKLDIISGGF